MAEEAITIQNMMVDRVSLCNMISAGDYLLISGDEDVLQGLPAGNWIAGTIPYFMSESGGKVDRDNLYVSKLSGFNGNLPRLTLYDTSNISRIAEESPEHGFTFLILPAHSDVHMSYAEGAPEFPNMFYSPIMGWIAGSHLDDLGKRKPKTGFGSAGGMLSETHAAAMHVPLPASQVANINIINLFSQGSGAAIRFPASGFSASACVIDGVERNLAEYIAENKIDTKMPLVADYSGIPVNVSIQDVTNDSVKFYAPVFSDRDYRFANPVLDYVGEFEKALQDTQAGKNLYSCNCILNYLYSELDGKKTGNLTGPFTFGEVAYQLVNQTMVYLTLENQG